MFFSCNAFAREKKKIFKQFFTTVHSLLTSTPQSLLFYTVLTFMFPWLNLNNSNHSFFSKCCSKRTGNVKSSDKLQVCFVSYNTAEREKQFFTQFFITVQFLLANTPHFLFIQFSHLRFPIIIISFSKGGST